MSDRVGRVTSGVRNNAGNVAIIFAFSLMAVFGAAGLALDFGRSHAVRTSVQSSLDAAVLAAAKTGESDDAAINAAVQGFMAKQSGLAHGAQLTAVSGKSIGTSSIKGEVTAELDTILMRVMGFPKVDIKLKSAVTRSLGRVAVALVLDTTKSMEGAKLSDAQSAAKQLVDKLYSLPGATGNVHVALVPFAQYVNVGLGNRYASWMNVPADGSQTSNFCSATYPNAVSSNCRMETFTSTQDGLPYTYTAQVCDWVWGDPVTVCEDQTTTLTWNGCAGSRAHPLNVQDGTYTTKIPGIMNVSCPGAVLPLTGQPDSIKASIDAMTADGDTYMPAGLAWGWRVLSSGEPFAESSAIAAQSSAPLRKFIVLMTDGQNSKSADYSTGEHTGSDASLANQVTTELCANIRADTNEKIEIFTVAFQVTDPTIKTILETCATPGGAFYDAVDYSQLLSAFESIGSTMTIARITN